ncbi:hypothetical protein ACKKBF_B34465 [Auxenochlorella protothecoides x Auxenochlorella symbiontica]
MKEKGFFIVSADLPLNAERYMLERDSKAFRDLLSRTLKIGTMEFVEAWTSPEGSQVVRLVTSPDFGAWVPKALQSQASFQKLEFHDIIEYAPSDLARPPYSLSVSTESPMLGHKLDIRLRLTVAPTSPDACRQTLEGRIRVGIFGLGRIVEGIVKDQLAATYRRLPSIVGAWCTYRQKCLAAGEGWRLLAGRPQVGMGVPWMEAASDPGQTSPRPAWEGRRPGPTPATPSAPDASVHSASVTPAATEYMDAREGESESFSSPKPRTADAPRPACLYSGAEAGAPPPETTTGMEGPKLSTLPRWVRTWVDALGFSSERVSPRSKAGQGSAEFEQAEWSNSATAESWDRHDTWTSGPLPPALSRGPSRVAQSMGSMVVESFNTASVSLLLGLTGAGILKIKPNASQGSRSNPARYSSTYSGHRLAGDDRPPEAQSALAFAKAGELLDNFLERASGEPLDATGLVRGTHRRTTSHGGTLLPSKLGEASLDEQRLPGQLHASAAKQPAEGQGRKARQQRRFLSLCCRAPTPASA